MCGISGLQYTNNFEKNFQDTQKKKNNDDSVLHCARGADVYVLLT